MAGWWVLKAEETLGHSREQALELLRLAQTLFPDHHEISDNLALLES